MTSPSTKVYVVDDDPAMRDSLELLLRSEGYEVEAHASGASFLCQVGPAMSGCLVTDLRIPGLSGLALQKEMQQRGIRLPVIFITGHGDVSSAVQAMKHGAIDFIEKPFSNETLLRRVADCIRRAHHQRQRDKHRDRLQQGLARLTPREREVMDYVTQGHSSKAIARQLGISPKTVDIHRARVLDKLGATSVANLIHLTAHLSRSSRGS
ncbi:response regulator transcription factor [Thiohalobacter thiocyanaticus]|uniref:DNA-binding response regulator n=1 Tax=Thiohalobacter thiocyanaticus TaxID=585455 RepID=A0A426QKX4_9GAMM|nr:response regulator [Thiohalobacter thiocyanaticus]RRQ22346.1 DNA-binding response regulator [Thiohalobacter thiocyanaticus]